MQLPVQTLIDQDDWVTGGYADIFEDRVAQREAEQKRKQQSSKPSQAARPPGRRRRR